MGCGNNVEVWVQCGDGVLERAQPAGTDLRRDVAVVRHAFTLLGTPPQTSHDSLLAHNCPNAPGTVSTLTVTDAG